MDHNDTAYGATTRPATGEWIRTYIAEHLKVNREMVETDMQFEDFGLDSRQSMEMVGALSEHVGAELDPSVVYDHSTIDALAAHVDGLLRESTPC